MELETCWIVRILNDSLIDGETAILSPELLDGGTDLDITWAGKALVSLTLPVDLFVPAVGIVALFDSILLPRFIEAVEHVVELDGVLEVAPAP